MRKVGLALGALLLVLPFSQASATDCSGVSLKGKWRYFSLNVIENPDAGGSTGAVEDCKFRVNSKGVIKKASCPDDDFIDNETEYEGERIKVSRSCGLELETVACRYVGQVEASADAAHGVAFCALLDRLSFDLIRD